MTEKLGERALEAMKQMDNAVVEFKIPSAPRTKKGQMKILTEEQYVEVWFDCLLLIFDAALKISFNFDLKYFFVIFALHVGIG